MGKKLARILEESPVVVGAGQEFNKLGSPERI